MNKFQVRLNANAHDFDGIVSDMLDEIRTLRNKKREYKHKVEDARNDLVEEIMSYGGINWTQEMTRDILEIIDDSFHPILKRKS